MLKTSGHVKYFVQITVLLTATDHRDKTRKTYQISGKTREQAKD